jgi:hypothetical protein
MAVTFNPAHTFVAWPDFSGTGGKQIKADQIEVTEGGAIVLSSVGDDGVVYITTVLSPTSFAHFDWYGDASVYEDKATPL